METQSFPIIYDRVSEQVLRSCDRLQIHGNQTKLRRDRLFFLGLLRLKRQGDGEDGWPIYDQYTSLNRELHVYCTSS